MTKRNTIPISIVAFALVVCSVVACTRNKYDNTVQGLKPIYALNNAGISLTAARTVVNAGKILQAGNTTFQVDNGIGLHVIDCTDLTAPKRLHFISVPGISEVHLQGSVLYVDHMRDLVSLQYANGIVTELSRLKDVVKLQPIIAPSKANTYYECPDDTKGTVVGWQVATLDNPKCKTL